MVLVFVCEMQIKEVLPYICVCVFVMIRCVCD